MNKSQSSPRFAQFGRIFWMMLGPGILAVTAVFIRQGTGWRTPANYIFLITLAATILARWLEVLGGHPLTFVEKPASPKDFYRYVIMALIAGVSLWILANTVGNRGRASQRSQVTITPEMNG